MTATTILREAYPMRLAELPGSLLQPAVGQVILLILAGMTNLSRIVVFGAIVHWALVAYIAFRRRNALSRRDVVFIRYAYLIFGGGAFIAFMVVGVLLDALSRK